MAELQLTLKLGHRISKDEESVPAHLRDTDDYKELMELKRIKRQKIVEYQVSCCLKHSEFHRFFCDESEAHLKSYL